MIVGRYWITRNRRAIQKFVKPRITQGMKYAQIAQELEATPEFQQAGIKVTQNHISQIACSMGIRMRAPRGTGPKSQRMREAREARRTISASQELAKHNPNVPDTVLAILTDPVLTDQKKVAMITHYYQN